ncbi:MAG: nicotinate phosphoribosyltransferase, partial [Schwartzia sp.]|nr:nicotinate phosphoribosyltransferase [Schwartzia sp. (in: firmicutes)]
AAVIGGAVGTATLLAGQLFDLPVSGTMAHSWVMYYDDEYTAFKKYAEKYPDATVLLIDTFDVLHSGAPNAIRVAKEVLAPMGKRLKGVRIDSGDLAYLSKRVRKMLDEAGLEDCKIIVSNSLDEYTISSILRQGGCIDAFGVGERLITAKSDPVFGAVYKMVEVNKRRACIPKIKISETFEKITNPGRKRVYRIYDEHGQAIADLLAGWNETIDLSKPYRYIDPEQPWKQRSFENCTARELQTLVVKDGQRVASPKPLTEIQAYVKKQLQEEIWEEEQRFENPHQHYLDMTPTYYEMKMDLLSEAKNGKKA